MRVAVVGVCASGKTTLVKGLQEAGVDAYNVAQEHSCIRSFWNKRNPDVLIMIDATLSAIKRRRRVSWTEERLITQHERLANAREHADLYIQTDAYSAQEVLEQVLAFLREKQAV